MHYSENKVCTLQILSRATLVSTRLCAKNLLKHKCLGTKKPCTKLSAPKTSEHQNVGAWTSAPKTSSPKLHRPHNYCPAVGPTPSIKLSTLYLSFQMDLRWVKSAPGERQFQLFRSLANTWSTVDTRSQPFHQQATHRHFRSCARVEPGVIPVLTPDVFIILFDKEDNFQIMQ